MKTLGLIAGNRKFPLIFADAARTRGYRVVAVAIKGDTMPRINKHVDKVYWLGLDEFSRMFTIFKEEGITQVIMAGQISPRRLFSKEVERDQVLKSLLKNIKNKKADTIFSAIALKLHESGLELLDSTMCIKDQMPQKGTLTQQEPDGALWEDIHFGLEQAKAIAGLDIGQSVAVKDKVVVAVEAFEGTDNLIRRAGKIARGGIVVVKVSKPKQDMRFDIPVVGFNTVKNLIKAGAKCLAIEADKTLFIDREKSLRLADKYNVRVVAV